MNRYDRHFHVLDEGKIITIDLEADWQATHSTQGEVNYQYYEMFYCEEFGALGCDYERSGCFIREGDVVVDVGGNMGIFARRAWERGASRIVSFEPQRLAFYCYSLNSKPQMESYNLAISDSHGSFELTFGENSSNTGGGSIFANYEARGIEIFHRERVIAVPLNHMYDLGVLNRVDFLKIDCEGAEGAVLRGISDERLSKIRCVSLEVHRSVISDEEREQFVERFSRLGFNHCSLFYAQSLVIYNFWK
jgi:FkbM family methyltransferase